MSTARSIFIQTHNLGPLESIPLGEGKVFRLGDLPVAVFRPRSGGVYATQAECPHRQGPLADGVVGGKEVLCPLHGYRFHLATGAPIGNGCQSLQTYRVWVDENGDLLLEEETL